MQSQDNPVVTFVVPCYKLAHLLRECVQSILDQTYTNLEVLIMDDCSPDNTPAVARSFADPRVRHIRNEPNLGHLQNYNKGIGLARGRYVWLISADDKLRRPYVLERFVNALDSNPGASFVFCPAMKFNTQGETGVYGAHGASDRMYSAPEFLRTLVNGNSVSAPAAMARKENYDRISGFPLDLPFAGDWYIWARFALDGDVVYLPEPMVSYRVHELNMTKGFLGPRAAALIRDELEVRWRLRRDAEAQRNWTAVKWVETALADDYTFRVFSRIASDSPYGLPLEAVEQSIREHFVSHRLTSRLQAVALRAAGDASYEKGHVAEARNAYGRSLASRLDFKTLLKFALSLLGQPGTRIRSAITSRRQDVVSTSYVSGARP